MADCSGVAVRVEVGAATISTTWAVYDASGDLVEWSVDTNGDGVADEVTTYAWDASGNLTDEWLDTNADGIVDEHRISTYFPSNNVQTFVIDVGDDGVFEYLYTYTEDANANLVLQEEDIGATGTIDSTYDWIYDVSNNLVREQWDQGVDLTYEAWSDYTLPGPSGGDFLREDDYDGNFSYDRTVEEWYSATDLLEMQLVDEGVDGIVDVDISFTYHSNDVYQGFTGTFYDGALVLVTGGFFDYHQQYTYDASGRVFEVYELADLDQNGAPGGPFDIEWIETWTWSGCSVP